MDVPAIVAFVWPYIAGLCFLMLVGRRITLGAANLLRRFGYTFYEEPGLYGYVRGVMLVFNGTLISCGLLVCLLAVFKTSIPPFLFLVAALPNVVLGVGT